MVLNSNLVIWKSEYGSMEQILDKMVSTLWYVSIGGLSHLFCGSFFCCSVQQTKLSEDHGPHEWIYQNCLRLSEVQKWAESWGSRSMSLAIHFVSTGIRDTRLMLLQRTMNQKFLLEVDIALFCIRLRMIYIMIYIYIPHCNLFFVLFLLFLYCL